MDRLPIRFVKKDDSGSAILRAHQMAEALRSRGHDALVAVSAADVRESLVVFVKHLEKEEIDLAAAQGNVVVFDPVDKFTFHDFSRYDADEVRRYFRGLHGVIHPNSRHMKDFREYFPEDAQHAVIHHHWDPRFRAAAAGGCRPGDRFSIGYIGDAANFVPAAPEVTAVFDYARRLDECGRFTCHYSVRTDSTGLRYKPATKVSVAACMEANIVTTRDDSALELLGADYPYFTDPQPEAVRETVRYARETFGSETWRKGLSRMNEVRARTRLSRIAKKYENFFLGLAGESRMHVKGRGQEAFRAGNVT